MSLTVRVATPEDRRGAFDTVLAPSFVFDELEPYDDRLDVCARSSGRVKLPLPTCGELWSGVRPPL